jgi:hypothetical protein
LRRARWPLHEKHDGYDKQHQNRGVPERVNECECPSLMLDDFVKDLHRAFRSRDRVAEGLREVGSQLREYVRNLLPEWRDVAAQRHLVELASTLNQCGR